MHEAVPRRTLLGHEGSWDGAIAAKDTREISRIWQSFMTARFTLGLVLVALQGTLYATGTVQNEWLIGVSLCYLASTLTTGLFGTPRLLGSTFNRPWIGLVGVDVFAFSSLQYFQGGNINYTPLFALPILLASVLGSLRLALGTAAGVTVLLLGNTLLNHLTSSTDAAPFFVQSALSGVGYFAIALLANQLSTRLASEGLRARRNQAAANVQRQVNALVIESLPDGVLIVDEAGGVRNTNPAAEQLLSPHPQHALAVQDLKSQAAWAQLLLLTQHSLRSGQGKEQDVTIKFEGQGPRRVRVRTRLTAPDDVGGEILCVLFLQDQRELEARMRTEKLASMGRMSTAVAHEIRNPLAAIAQANALLEEDLHDPRQISLTKMVSQNAQRLAKIVDDILNASHIQAHEGKLTPLTLSLNEAASRICKDWALQTSSQHRLHTELSDDHWEVYFDGDHLRRVLVNLLDNARRYASEQPTGIQVQTQLLDNRQARLSVWSDGPPMDQSVELHLFEPFFSSESRSSGLGLYICRELCESYGASIDYQRASRFIGQHAVDGNEFSVTLERPKLDSSPATLHTTPTAWQTAT